MNSTIASGTRLGRYEILSKLGAGGMGEVYLAGDTELGGRKVALKMLSAELALDKQRLQRFFLEARAASALSHPNVAHIYEVIETQGSHLIAIEYVEGQTLRDRIESHEIRIVEALEIAIQAAAALAAAHDAGVVHRDIKPENIMMRRDGFVKVLDFGLAKLTDKSTMGRLLSSDASILIRTDPGTVMGTVSYMSPEQARGQELDERTDIFSLGVVLYEMITGRRPFKGTTASDVIAAILERQPTPLISETAPAPDGLKEANTIVLKALEKKIEERYQTIRSFAADLQRLKRHLDARAELQYAALPETTLGIVEAQDARRAATVITPQGAAQQTKDGRAVSSREYTLEKTRSYRMRTALAGLGLLVVLTGAYGVYRLFKQRAITPKVSSGDMKITRLTSDGKVGLACISPDGKYIAYSVRAAGQESVWIKQLSAPTSVQRIPPANGRYRGLTFAPDGSYIYYVLDSEAQTTLYQIPVLGGGSRKVLADVDTAITFSQDAKRFAFVRDATEKEESAIMIANVDGTGEYALSHRKANESFNSILTTSKPAWSPDGRVIATIAATADKGPSTVLLFVDVNSGAIMQLDHSKLNSFLDVEWLRDSNGLLVTGNDNAQQTDRQVWQLSYPNGEASKLTRETSTYRVLSLTADNRSLVAVETELVSSISVAPASDFEHTKQVVVGKGGPGYFGLAWTPDNRLIYQAKVGENYDIFIAEADGSGSPVQLTMNVGNNYYPVVTPDGRYILFGSKWKNSYSQLWRMDRDGGNPKQLTTDYEYMPQCSPDGKWMVYISIVKDGSVLSKMPIEGGNPAQLTKVGSADYPAISPDGTLIACFYSSDARSPLTLSVFSFSDGQLIKSFPDVKEARGNINMVRWTFDGRALAYVVTRGDVSNIWTQSLDGGRPKQLTNFTSERIFGFDWTRDGKQLAIARGRQSRNVVLITNF
jgi:Tol biopolymer transport system component